MGVKTMHMGEASFESIPAGARIFTTFLSMITFAALACFLLRRIQNIKSWRKISATGYLILAIYVDSGFFVLGTSTLAKNFSLDHAQQLCGSAILLCLVFWFTTKILIYFFFVEKAHIVIKPWSTRREDKLYLFNMVGMMGPYIGIFVLCFIFRYAYINRDGQCVVGVREKLVFVLTSAELVLNIYLTSLFLIPLRKLHSVRHGSSNGNSSLRTIAIRTFVGSCTTLAVTIANVLILGVLHGERGWVCLVVCNVDILVSACVLHWVTSVDRQGEMSTVRSQVDPRSSAQVTSRGPLRRTTLDTPDDLPDFELPPDISINSTSSHGSYSTQKSAIIQRVVEAVDAENAGNQFLQLPSQQRRPSVQFLAELESPRRPSASHLSLNQEVRRPSVLRTPSDQFPETTQDFQMKSAKHWSFGNPVSSNNFLQVTPDPGHSSASADSIDRERQESIRQRTFSIQSIPSPAGDFLDCILPRLPSPCEGETREVEAPV
ncbi:hypothetical protein MBLNU459_g0839t2 [Dothideomycetes sp. NU459]